MVTGHMGWGVPCACAHGMDQPWPMACIGMGMSMEAVLRNKSGFKGSDGISLKQRKRTSRATLDENNVCSSSLIALPTCASSRWAIIPCNGRHPARHCANMPLAELITNFIIMRLGHAQSQSGCVQQHAIAPPLITRKSKSSSPSSGSCAGAKGVGTTRRNQHIHKTRVIFKPSC